MVQLASFGNFRPESELPSKGAAAEEAAPVKLEIEDPLDEQYGPLNKRSKITAPLQQQWSETADTVPPQALQYNVLHEPSPLGLRLRKSPSLVDLIQMRLSQDNGISESSDVGKKVASAMGALAADKMKASNFPASLLRIGTWEYASTYEGDLVAKCYFAKHKLVWEVLHGGLKSKIEIQWSDITSLKATCPENGPGTLDIVLARQPLFFREVNPQPRKHTLWQAASDFTDGQASIHRRHFLQCSQGSLSKHVEKLIQCDPRLYALSQQPNIILENPYFEPGCSVFKDQDESNCHGFDNLKDAYGSPMQGFQDSGSPHSGSSMSTKSEVKDPFGRAADVVAQDTCSPSSVMDTQVTEEQATSEAEEFKDPRRANQFKVPEIQPSVSVSDLMNHIGHCISEQINSGNPPSSGNGLPTKDMLEEMTRYLLSDSQTSSVYDEKSLMLRVNSLCSLIQKDPGHADQFKVSGVRPSMSMSDLVNHIGHCISEQINSGNPPSSGDGLPTKDMLEEMTRYLLSDSQTSFVYDEKSLMVRVNSLCNLIQGDPETAQSLQINSGNNAAGDDVMDNTSKLGSTTERKPLFDFPAPEGEPNDSSGCKQPAKISRRESFGELLMHLPRIASLHQFLFNISEDAGHEAR